MGAFDTHDCKTPNCDGEALATRGRLAYLCSRCIKGDSPAQLLARAARPPDEQPAPAPARAPVVVGSISYEAKAKELVPAGKTLDKAMKKVTRHRAAGEAKKARHTRAGEGIQRELAQAVKTWNAKLDGLKMGGQ